TVLRVRDVENGAERQRAMCRGELQRIEDLAVRGGTSGELLPVPARDAVHRLVRGHWLRRRRRRGAGGGEDNDDCGAGALQTRTSAISRATSFSARTGSTSSVTNRSVCCRARPV